MEYTPRLKTKYKEEIIPSLKKNYKSVMQVPSLKKICINQGVGKGSTDKKIDPESNEQDIYRSALIAALHDETISDDELAILDTLAESMQLTNLERNAVLTMVKSEENQGIDGSRLDRLERFLNRTMN